MAMTENFRELSEKLGGFNPEALDTLFYWNNPLALKHWTMNVIEILLCAGAVLGLMHAIRRYRSTNNPTNLCYWILTVGLLFVTEVPLYFPELVGADPNQLRFLHNEFTAGLLYDRTPLYIVALYPALMYPSYVVIERTGIFNRKWGLLLGAISVGFLHQCFYEIFDQYGPQYGWWVWNYSLYGATEASVPLASIYTFAFVAPLGLALVTRLLVASYVKRRNAAAAPIRTWHLALLCIVGSVLAFIPLVIFSPDLYYQIFLQRMPSPQVEAIVAFVILAAAGLVTLAVSLKAASPSTDATVATVATVAKPDSSPYPLNFFIAYLVVFAALWIYALPELLSATNGMTERGTPIGSLGYVLGCYVLAIIFLYLNRAARRTGIPAAHRAAQHLAGSV